MRYYRLRDFSFPLIPGVFSLFSLEDNKPVLAWGI